MPLESGRSIRKSKRHDFVFKASYTSSKCSKVFIFLCSHSNPIEGMADINLRKEFRSCDLSKCFLNKGERVSIFLHDCI